MDPFGPNRIRRRWLRRCAPRNKQPSSSSRGAAVGALPSSSPEFVPQYGGTRTGRAASCFRCTGTREASLADAIGIEHFAIKIGFVLPHFACYGLGDCSVRLFYFELLFAGPTLKHPLWLSAGLLVSKMISLLNLFDTNTTLDGLL
jgi:hypothetical protein